MLLLLAFTVQAYFASYVLGIKHVPFGHFKTLTLKSFSNRNLANLPNDPTDNAKIVFYLWNHGWNK